MVKPGKTDEKAHKVFCEFASKDDTSYLTFAEFIIQCEFVLESHKGIRIYSAPSSIPDKMLSKWSVKIISVVNQYLSDSTQSVVQACLRSVGVLTWSHTRKALMECFGQVHLDESDSFSKLIRVNQSADESPNRFYQKMKRAQEIYCVSVDYHHGDGLKDSAKAKLKNCEKTYPYYFLENPDTMKLLYFGGLLKFIRDGWYRIKGAGAEVLKYCTIQDVIRFAESAYLHRKEQRSLAENSGKRSNTNANQMEHFSTLSDDDDLFFHMKEKPSTESRESIFKRVKEKSMIEPGESIFKRTKENSIESSGVNKIIDTILHSSDGVKKSIDKLCSSNAESINKICTATSSNIKQIDNLFSMFDKKKETFDDYVNPAVNSSALQEEKSYEDDSLCNVFQRRTRKAMNAGTPGTQSCWICQSTDHFAPKCPYISPTELYIIVYNQLYRTNLNGSKTTPGYKIVTFDQACQKWGITPPTDEEMVQIEKIYEPLRNKEPRNTEMKGANEKAYCHFCHANGHYTRDCKRRCVYCLQRGHGWKACTVEKYQAVITARKALMPQGNNARSMKIHGRITSLLHCEELVSTCA